MVEILEGKSPFFVTTGEVIDTALLGAIYQVEDFHLKAYYEFEAYFDEPEPYLELDLSSAAVIVRIRDNNSILLVESRNANGERRVEIPAGKVIDGVDDTIFHTAAREFDEETGGIITLPRLKPLTVTHHRDGRGGLLFYAEIPKPRVERTDKLGRGYLTPPEGTDRGRTTQLVSEPLDIFLDPEQTLLRHSQNKWAVNKAVLLTVGMYILQLDTAKK